MRPAFKILANEQNITDAIKERLISLSVTDEVGLTSDTFNMLLDNRDDKLEVPERGAVLNIFLGYEEKYLVSMGKFLVDEIEDASPPHRMTITGRASDSFNKGMYGGLKASQSRSWHEITILDMITKIALENGLTPLVAPELSEITIEHEDQTDESDISMLNRIAQENDSYVKPANGLLIMGIKGSLTSPTGRPMPIISLTKERISEWRVRIAERGKFGKVNAKYRDTKSGLIETITVGNDGLSFNLKHTYASKYNAKTAAKAKLKKLNEGTHQIELSTTGDAEICAESILDITNTSRSANGIWQVSSVSHEFSTSGYTTRISGRKEN